MTANEILDAIGNVDEECVRKAKENQKYRKPIWMKAATLAAGILIVAGIGVGIHISGIAEPVVSPSNDENVAIEYNYSMIQTHPSLSAGMTMPYDINNLTEWSDGFIEFVVLSEPEEVTFEYVNQERIDNAIKQNYSEEDMKIVYNEARQKMTYPQVSILIENIFFEKEGANLKDYDKIWLAVDALKHSESFIPGARFAAYVQFMDDPYSPVDLFIDSFFYYIDENNNLIPFTDDPSLMQYGGYSLEKMAELTLTAEAKLKSDSE